MLSELVFNAKRFSTKDRTTISLQWTVTRSELTCSVHDDAPSSPLANVRGLVPLDIVLEIVGKTDRPGTLHGLDLINRLATIAQGTLLFGQSPLTSGLQVKFSVMDVAAASDETHENE